MLGLILYLLVIGVVAGYLARLLVPGRDPMSFWQTVALGVIGSFVGGLLGYVLFDHDLDQGALQASGIIGSIVGAIIALLVWRAISGNRRTASPARR
jgi:uncharacterized membrane protein YeaQ/YmgE (transglycosylase-associated protein family)